MKAYKKKEPKIRLIVLYNTIYNRINLLFFCTYMPFDFWGFSVVAIDS